MSPTEHPPRKPPGEVDEGQLPRWRCEVCDAEIPSPIAPDCHGQPMKNIVEIEPPDHE